ncbi:MAG: ABC transporter ATP-binding protein [Gemmatimonadota bacterium]
MSVYIRILKYLEPYRLIFIVSLAALTLGALLDGFSMILLIPFLRSLFGEANILTETGGLVDRVLDLTVGGLIDQGNPGAALRSTVLVIMAAILLKNLFFYAASVLGVRVQLGVVRDMRDQLYAHIQRLPLGFFDRFKTGQLVARVFSDTEKTREIISYAVVEVVKHIVSLIAFAAMLFIISWQLTLLALLVAPLFLGFLRPMLWRLRRGFRSAFDAQGELTNLVQETASGARVVKAYTAEEYEQGRFAGTNRQFYKSALRAERIRLLSSPLSEILGSAVTIVIVLVGAQIVFSGGLTAEAFLTFLTISLRVQSPLKALSTFPVRAQSSLAAADRFFEILDTSVEPRSLEARRIDGFEDAIVYDDVYFAYDEDEPVLEGVSFEVKRGEIAALVGPSGAGKSTIADLLPRFYEVTGGKITVDGVDIRALDLISLRHLMGVVSQETVIFHDTVKANIAYGDPERYSHEEIQTAARAANAHEFICRLPDRYDTILGDRGVRLSGGQRQRIAIARAILRDPPILILDEATSALDSESERLVQQAIDRLLANRTVIVIAHRLSTIQNAHQILVIDQGRIVEAGHHGELLELGGIYSRLSEIQLSRTGDPVGKRGSSEGVTVS